MNITRMNSVNEVQRELCSSILSKGRLSSPRKMKTLELLGVSFEISNPRNRITTIAERKWSSALAVGELAWNLRGEEDVEPLAFYAPRWREFADDSGFVRGSCYGAKIFSHSENGRSQWENVLALLSSDQDSRRGVLNFRSETDVSCPTRDLSCVNTMQFLIRDGKLHSFVNMRSNDAIWGVPYDVFLFTSLQEMMACELSLELGTYHHYAASMHVYERHFDLAKRIALSGDCDDGAMAPLRSSASLREFAFCERDFRARGTPIALTGDEMVDRCSSIISKFVPPSQSAA